MNALIFDTPQGAGSLIFDAQVPFAAPPAIVPVSDPEFEDWLRDSAAIRTLLLESEVLSGGMEVMRFTCKGVFPITGPADTPPNTFYAPAISVGVQFTEQLSLAGAASVSVGDIEFDNVNGVRESWHQSDIWSGRGQRMYLGDPRWNRSSYRPVFNGVASGIAPKARGVISLKLRDQMQRLDVPLTERRIGGASLAAEVLYPLCFGECHNVTPVYDPTTDTYYVHDGAVEWIFEIRVNGMPVSAIVDNASGSFRLAAGLPPGGVVTCSVQGDKFEGIYRNTVAPLIQRIVTGYGKEEGQFTDDDIDLENFAQFDASHPQRVGIYISDRPSVKTVCAALADSLGTQMVPSRLGKLRLIQIGFTGESTFDIRIQHMVGQTLTPVARFDPVAAVTLAFDRNYTPQANLLTGISDEIKALFADEWLYASDSDEQVKADYKLTTAVVPQNTQLKVRAETKAEATRRLGLRKVKRTLYKFEGTPEMLRLELGQELTVFHHENNMELGVPAIVMLLTPNWEDCHCEVGVLV